MKKLNDYKNKPERGKKRTYVILVLIILIILVVGFIYLFKMYNSRYHRYKIVSSVANTDNTSSYISYRGGVIKYSKNGAIAYKKNGETLWNIPYEMSNPISDICGKYAVISDREGKRIYLFDEKGLIGSVTTLYSILDVDIASQGVIAVQMYEDDSNYIHMYYVGRTVTHKGKEEDLIVDIKKGVKDNGYLMDIDMSKDGKKIAVDFFLVTSGKIFSDLGFFNYGDVGQNAIDNFMGGIPFEGTVIPKIKFLNNDVICAFKDYGFIIYSMSETPKLIKEITFKHNIKSIFYNEKYIGVVLDEDTKTPKKLLLYNLNGKKILDQKLDFTYKEILLSRNEIIMYNDTTCVILRFNGKEKFKYTFDTNIKAFYGSSNQSRYLLVTSSEISEIKLHN